MARKTHHVVPNSIRMPEASATFPPGHYIIGDPRYLEKYEPYYHRFYTGGDGAFYDSFDNCYYVDSATIAVFEVRRKPNSLPEGTHYFAFGNNWTIVFDADALDEEIKITPTPFKEPG